MGGDAGRGAGGRVVGGGRSDAVLKNERKLPQGPAVRFADRRHPLRRGPDGFHRPAVPPKCLVRHAPASCGAGNCDATRRGKLEQTSRVLTAKERYPRSETSPGTRGPSGSSIAAIMSAIRNDGRIENLTDTHPKNALWPIWDEVSASALGSGPRGATSRRSRRPMVRSGTRCLRLSRGCHVLDLDAAVPPLRADVGAPLRVTLGRRIDNLLSIRILQAAGPSPPPYAADKTIVDESSGRA